MSQYPTGAGPTSGRFSGTVYTPPAAGVRTLADTDPATTSSTRPSVAHASAAVDSAGRMVATFTAPTTAAWLVRRIVVQSTVRGQALVYVGGIEAGNLVCGTVAGNLDENDPNQPYLVPEGQALAVHWVDGGTCSARIEYVEV